MAQHILVFGIRVYRRLISPAKAFVFGPFSQCRFTPSCSAYALESIQQHGAIQGTWLASKRLCRCHPWGGCGLDPVPPGPLKKTKFFAPFSSIAGIDQTDPARGGSPQLRRWLN